MIPHAPAHEPASQADGLDGPDGLGLQRDDAVGDTLFARPGSMKDRLVAQLPVQLLALGAVLYVAMQIDAGLAASRQGEIASALSARDGLLIVGGALTAASLPGIRILLATGAVGRWTLAGTVPAVAFAVGVWAYAALDYAQAAAVSPGAAPGWIVTFGAELIQRLPILLVVAGIALWATRSPVMRTALRIPAVPDRFYAIVFADLMVGSLLLTGGLAIAWSALLGVLAMPT